MSCKDDAAACRPKVETLTQNHQHLPARQSCRTHRRAGHSGRWPAHPKHQAADQHHACRVSMHMHVQSHRATPAGVIKGDAVAKAALTFLCTQPHHCISACAESCHAMMMLHACRPKVVTLAEHHAHLPARQPHVACIAEQGTQGASRPILSTKTPDQHHACLVSMRMHVQSHRATPAGVFKGDAVAKAALTFLCTQPHHCISACAESCHAMMMLLCMQAKG